MNYGTQRALISGGSRRWLVHPSLLLLTSQQYLVPSIMVSFWTGVGGLDMDSTQCFVGSPLLPFPPEPNPISVDRRGGVQLAAYAMWGPAELSIFPLLSNIYIKLLDESHDHPRPSKRQQHPECFSLTR